MVSHAFGIDIFIGINCFFLKDRSHFKGTNTFLLNTVLLNFLKVIKSTTCCEAHCNISRMSVKYLG